MKSVTPVDPSQWYPDLLDLPPPLLLSNTGTRNGVVFESHKLPGYRCIFDDQSRVGCGGIEVVPGRERIDNHPATTYCPVRSSWNTS